MYEVKGVFLGLAFPEVFLAPAVPRSLPLEDLA